MSGHRPIRVSIDIEPGRAEAKITYSLQSKIRLDGFVLEINANHERASLEVRGAGHAPVTLRGISALLGLASRGVKIRVYGLRVQLEYGREDKSQA